MKTLYLLRHAKSSWEGSSQLRDLDRPLNERGMRDAPVMAARLRAQLKKQGIKLSVIVSSPAQRTRRTTEIFAEVLQLQPGQIQFEPQIYLAGSGRLLQLARRFDETAEAVLLVGHNPALTDFANELSNGSIENIPTCGLVTLQLPIEFWGEIEFGMARQLSFDYPKQEESSAGEMQAP